MSPIRILHVLGGVFRHGGTETFLMSYYRNIDRSKIQFDFVVHGFEKGVYDDEVKELGGKIYNVPIKSKDYFGNIRALKTIFNSGEYFIVHSHMDAMGMVVLKLAKKYGISVRLAHALNTDHQTNNKIQYALHEYARNSIKKYATHLLACSELAAKWLYGEDAVKTGSVKIVKTAIDYYKFNYNDDYRNRFRHQMNIEDIGLEPIRTGLKASPTKVKNVQTKGAKSAGKVHELDPRESAKLIVEKLKEKYVI